MRWPRKRTPRHGVDQGSGAAVLEKSAAMKREPGRGTRARSHAGGSRGGASGPCPGRRSDPPLEGHRPGPTPPAIKQIWSDSVARSLWGRLVPYWDEPPSVYRPFGRSFIGNRPCAARQMSALRGVWRHEACEALLCWRRRHTGRLQIEAVEAVELVAPRPVEWPGDSRAWRRSCAQLWGATRE